METPTPTKQAPPRGIRNNNPGNIRYDGKIVWLGEMRPDTEGYCIFSAPTYGIRAMFITFRTYQEVHRLNTPRLMLSRWAPRIENDLDAYLRDVCSRGGFSPELPLDLNVLGVKWCQCITQHENGIDPYNADLYHIAIDMAQLR